MSDKIPWQELYDLAFPPDADRLPGGQVRCTAKNRGNGQRCSGMAIKGTTVCRMHGGAAPQVREAGQNRLQEAEAARLARLHVGEVDLSKFTDPLEALEFVIGYNHALARKLAKMIEAIDPDKLRYVGKLSEQVRGEITMYDTISRSLVRTATDALRLGIEERRVAIEEATAVMLERALDAALEESGVDLTGQLRARQAFQRNLTVIRGELEQAEAGDDAA